MPAIVGNPVLATLGTTEVDLTTGPAAATEEWLVDIRLTNKTTTPVDCDIAIADTGNTVKAYEINTYTLSGKDSKDITLKGGLPFGYKIRGRASIAASVDVRIFIRKRATNL